MADTRTASTASGAPTLTGARAGVFVAYRIVIVVVLVALLVQVFLAGLGVFGAEVAPVEDEASGMEAHRALGHMVTTIGGALLLLTALIARPGKRIVLLTVAWVVLGQVQVFLALGGEDAAVVGGLHALVALVLVGLAADLTRRANPRLLTR